MIFRGTTMPEQPSIFAARFSKASAKIGSRLSAFSCRIVRAIPMTVFVLQISVSGGMFSAYSLM